MAVVIGPMVTMPTGTRRPRVWRLYLASQAATVVTIGKRAIEPPSALFGSAMTRMTRISPEALAGGFRGLR